MTRVDDHVPPRARVHADVERPDTIMFGLALRQLSILAATGLVLYASWTATAAVLPPLVFLIVAIPVGAAAFAAAVGRRDGISLDSWLVAAIRHRLAPHRLVPADETIVPAPAWVATTAGHGHRLPLPAPLTLPAKGITDKGLIDLGPDGATALVAASTVNLGLRTPAEQHGLLAGFGQWLNSLDTSVQILVRAHPVDLTGHADRLLDAAAGLPHPALEHAARSHAAFLEQLAAERELLHRQVIVAVRDQRSGDRAMHRAHDTAHTLARCDVTADLLDGPAAARILAACLNPGGEHP